MMLLLHLLMLVFSARTQHSEFQKVRFGARMKQASSSCRDRINCQFGSSFTKQIKDNLLDLSGAGSDFREIVFIPPTTQVTPPPATEDPVTEEWQPIQQHAVIKNAKRRKFLVNFDPRRRMKSKKEIEEVVEDRDSKSSK